MKRKIPALASGIASLLGTGGGADAATVSAVLKSVAEHSSTGTRALNVTSSTATWSYNTTTGVLSQTGGLFNARLTITATTTLYRHSITGMVMGGGGSASASAFACSEGNFGGNVGASICGNYNFGANFINESMASWGPGTATARTLGGDDMAFGPMQSIAAYNNFVTLDWVGTTLRLSNATPTRGYTWTLEAGNYVFPGPPQPGFSLVIDDDLGTVLGINNLDILGTRYDVAFSGGLSGNTFFGDGTAAAAAVDAINGALGGHLNVNNDFLGRYQVAFSPTEAIQACNYTPEGCLPYPVSQPWGRIIGSASRNFEQSVGFSLSAVPVPAAVWLFGGALGALAAIRRRQKAS